MRNRDRSTGVRCSADQARSPEFIATLNGLKVNIENHALSWIKYLQTCE
jgi:hypothetical protein